MVLQVYTPLRLSLSVREMVGEISYAMYAQHTCPYTFCFKHVCTPAISQPIQHTTMIPKIEISRLVGQKEERRIGSGELDSDLRRPQQGQASWPTCSGCEAQQTGSHPWTPETNTEGEETYWYCKHCTYKKTGWWHYDNKEGQTKGRNGTQYAKCVEARKRVAKELEAEGRKMLDAAKTNSNWTEKEEQRKLGNAKLEASKCAAAELAEYLKTWDENGDRWAMARYGGSSSSGMEVDSWM